MCMQPSMSKSCCKNDKHFKDHQNAMEILIQTLEREFPWVTLAWHSMTAVHIHQVSSRCTGLNPTITSRCNTRVKYMSSSRAAQIYNTQLETISQKHPEVHIVKLYDLTCNRGHLVRPGDGRHYLPVVNTELWQMVFGGSEVNSSLKALFFDGISVPKEKMHVDKTKRSLQERQDCPRPRYQGRMWILECKCSTFLIYQFMKKRY